MASLKELKSLILRPKYTFCSTSSQIPKSAEPLFAWERLQFCRIIFPLASLLASFSTKHKPKRYVSCFTLNIFLSLKSTIYNDFWVYFESDFLQRIILFSVFESVSFCTLRFLRGPRSRPWSIIWDTGRWSILSSRAISAGAEWLPGEYSWIRIISSTSSELFFRKLYFHAHNPNAITS